MPSPQGNGSIKGHFARPATGTKWPAVLVVHENRDEPHIEDVARRLATGFHGARAGRLTQSAAIRAMTKRARS